jgi:hypothetical protein
MVETIHSATADMSSLGILDVIVFLYKTGKLRERWNLVNMRGMYGSQSM